MSCYSINFWQWNLFTALIAFKFLDLIPHVYSRKQKQVELHVLPTLWSLLNSMKGNSSSSSGTPLNHSVTKLIQNLYEQMGEQLIDRAANSSSVSSRNLELLRELVVPSDRWWLNIFFYNSIQKKFNKKYFNFICRLPNKIRSFIYY